MSITISCPLCSWTYNVKPLDPMADNPMALAGMFGPGVFQQHARNSQAQRTEEALQRHFASHKLSEWVAKVSMLERRVRELEGGTGVHMPRPQAG